MTFTHNLLQKPGLLTGFFVVLVHTVSGQYSYKPVKDAVIYGTSLSMLTVSMILQKKVQAHDLSYIRNLSIENVPVFDRYACRHYSRDAAIASDILVVSGGLSFAFFLNENSRKDFGKIANTAFESVLLSQGIANIFKLGLRDRPYLYNPDVPESDKQKRDSRFSYFSAHTATLSSLCWSFSLAYNTYNPNRHTGQWIRAGAIVLPAVQGFLRMKAGKHFLSDVISGYLCGMGSAYLMHLVHK